MFVDHVKILVKAGNGGKGCRSFYRDKYTRKGIPDGGDGGKGADIILRVDQGLRTLIDLQYHREYRGENGANGSGKNKKGKDASPVIIRVPQGTVVKDAKTGLILRDLKVPGEEVVVAQGGRGGLGNKHKFVTEVMPGQPGEQRELILDLMVLADVGVVGFPNVGKSTFINAVSNAHSEIAAYPFTTKSAVLGVVGEGEGAFVIADIPGLIEGSSEGRGLGHRFLRHIERTKLLLHLIDMAALEARDPIEDFRIINSELKRYNPQLSKKLQIVVANKMDIPSAAVNLQRFKRAVKNKVYPISALKKTGLEELIERIKAILQ